MKNLFAATLTIIACFAFKADDIKVSLKDFKPAFGNWKGSLTYLDYTSGKPYTMPANVIVTENTSNNNELVLAYDYPKEPKANGNDTLTIDKNGLYINKGKVISKKKLADDIFEIVTLQMGKDGNDNKPATIRHTFLISEKHFSNQKDVQFVGETKWIERDMYSFER